MRVCLNRTGSAMQLRFPFNQNIIDQLNAVGAEFKGNSKDKYWLLHPTEKAFDFLASHNFTADKAAEAKMCKWLDDLIIKVEGRPYRQLLAHATSAPVIDSVMKNCHFKDIDGNPCQPRAYQWVPCHYAPFNNGSMLLLDAMGIGKTVQSIMVSMLEEYQDKPVIIVCPPSVIGNWQVELKKMFEVKSHIINKPIKKLDPKVRFYIVSYFQTHKVPKDIDWFVIIDEVHNYKNTKTAKYENLEENILASKSCLIGLSGTPLPNRPGELFTSMTLVEPGFYKWFDFGIEFCAGKKGYFGWDFKGASNLPKLHQMLYDDFAVRREKEQVLSELPPKVRQVVSLCPELEVEAETVIGTFAESARQKAKSSEFLDALADAMQSGGKTLVFAHHKEMLDAIQEQCKGLGLKFIRIDGTVPAEKRQDLVQTFQEDPSVRIAILSITAAGEGLNLQKAETVIFAELYWVAAKIMQAEDRAHRPGVKHSVLCLYLLWGAKDHDVHEMVLRKAGLYDRVLSGKHLDISDDDMFKILSQHWGCSAGPPRKKTEGAKNARDTTNSRKGGARRR